MVDIDHAGFVDQRGVGGAADPAGRAADPAGRADDNSPTFPETVMRE